MFTIPKDKLDALGKWSEEQDAVIAGRQGDTVPYYGAVGGELTYSFTPTTIGLIIKVRHAMTGAEIDLTDWDGW